MSTCTLLDVYSTGLSVSLFYCVLELIKLGYWLQLASPTQSSLTYLENLPKEHPYLYILLQNCAGRDAITFLWVLTAPKHLSVQQVNTAKNI